MPPPVTTPRFHLAFGSLSFLIGLALIVGGPQRASAPAYNVITDQGGVYIWGTVFVVLGTALMLSVNRPWLMMRLLVTGAIAYWVLATAFLASAFMSPDANFTAMIAYGWISIMHCCAFRRVRSLHPEIGNG